ncbi:Sarcosine/dimethylglycine N-methyltransferase [Mycobacterium innocens]|uniref:Sarcosine/dimethylglycine N-methyltransferase n=2 Tax=Mycobacterium innocens TaxID=2341083 RepID=A0A498PQN1_9MYCO|nr:MULTISPECIES: methyltransferase domain-containing protein [Mycobacterium]VBA35902.1 Sarcosine/dimethylglycine N-methyltransferase [Mycobacterium innocens]
MRVWKRWWCLGQWLASPEHPALSTRQAWLTAELFGLLPDTVRVAVDPGFFADNYLQLVPLAAQLGVLPVPTGSGRNAPPSNEDIARVAVGALLDPHRHDGRAYRPTGPTLLSGADIADAVGEALGRPHRNRSQCGRRRHHACADHRVGPGAEMTDNQIHTQYSTGLTQPSIRQALRAAGKDLEHLRPADLTLLEDFHTMGRFATTELVDLIRITADMRVLDAGSGIGGTARFVADRCRCRVTAVDLSDEYCQTNRWLNRLVGLDERISVRHADVTELPFADATFDVVFSQHVQMNVAAKTRLYRETRRVTVAGGRLAMWDITIGEPGELDYPLPWADQPGRSHLVTAGELRAVVESAGFAVEHWSDLTEQATTTMQLLLSMPANPLGLHAFVADFAQKAENLTRALGDGRLRVIRGIARAGARAIS